MKTKSLRNLSILLALAIIFSVFPAVSTYAASTPKVTFEETSKNGNYYVEEGSKQVIKVKVSNASKKYRLVISVDGNPIFDKKVGNETISKTLKNYSLGEHLITADLIRTDGETIISKTKLRIFSKKAYEFVNTVNLHIGSPCEIWYLKQRTYELYAKQRGGKETIISLINEDTAEYIEFRDNKSYVNLLYSAFLQREGEDEGVNWWTTMLNNYDEDVKNHTNKHAGNKLSRAEVFQYFVNCDEFHKKMDDLGFLW